MVIGRAESGDCLDPEASPVNWLCRLYDRAGECVGDGNAETAVMAMAMTWLSHWCSDVLVTGRVEIGAVPFNVAEGWRFVLTPPRQSK